MAGQQLSEQAFADQLRGLLRHRPDGVLWGAPWLSAFADPRARRLLSQGEDAVLATRLVSDLYELHDYRRWSARPVEPIVTAALAATEVDPALIEEVVAVLRKCEDYLSPAPLGWLRRLRELHPGAAEMVVSGWRAGTGRLGAQLRILDTDAAIHLVDARGPEPSSAWLTRWAVP